MILIFGVNLSLNSLQIFNSNNEFRPDNSVNNNELKSSAISEKIHIDNNWTDARDFGICTGSGNYSDPYIIKDLVIDGGGFGSCILIENSEVFFKIENCTLHNSGGPFMYNYAGILLSNVSNGHLLNNSCYYNSYGIYLIESPNITIDRNHVANNYFGITLYYNGLTIVSNNNVSINDYGISLWDSDDNRIFNNTLMHNGYFGIRFFGNQNIVSDNFVYNSNGGILVQRSHHNLVTRNLAYKNAQGIYLDRSGNNNISENIASYNDHSGIRLFESRTNRLSRNIINNNTQNGILLTQNSNLNDISGNNATSNRYGIYLQYSNDNIVSGNGLIGNNICIFEEDCKGNDFYDNGECIPSNNEDPNDNPPALDFNLILLLSGSVIIGIIVITEVRKVRKRKLILEKSKM
jgi:parallel beta-helix repeat protein